MRPNIISHVPTPRRATREARFDQLAFRRMTPADIPELLPLLHSAPWRTCDFTAGGMLMWADMFRYEYCVRDNTLFVKGVAEDDVTLPAFSLPVGQLPLEQSVAIVLDYCRRQGIEARFSAVPAEVVPRLVAMGATRVDELTDWADYLYDAASLASLSGKKLNKKRNHLNRFMADNPGYTFEPLSAANIDAVRRFHSELTLAPGKASMAEYERRQVALVLDNPSAWPFEGVVLSVPGRKVVAFTMAEPVADTLHIHIEKMDHEVAGAGETINCLFARMMTERHPQLRFINRQDDAGDPGLRRAKESYHPVDLLKKYNVVF